MICEAQMQVHIRQAPKPAPDVVFIDGQRVRIDRTPQHFGGTRAWFLCPACHRRCTVLYPVACRKCRGLYYQAEHLSPRDRATVKAQRLRMQLGATSGNLSLPIPAKPSRMRWHTYLAARAAIKEADRKHLLGMWTGIQKLRGRAGSFTESSGKPCNE